MYIQRLYRSVFQMRNSKVALKRFRKLRRKRAHTTGFERLMTGFGDRLDVNLMLLKLVPSTFWARIAAGLGLLRVNGKEVTDPHFRFKPGDFVEWVRERVQKLHSFFRSKHKHFDKNRILRDTSLHLPGNFEYYPTLRAALYKRRPNIDDLDETGRINAVHFIWHDLDSGRGH